MLLSNILTLADWSVLINALMAALMIGYGFWIHHIVKQQEKLKDATIQALQAALTAKEAEISRLTGDIAPNIVKAYEGMREHADKVTAELMEQQGRIQKAEATKEFVEALFPALGLKRGYDILIEKCGKYMPPNEQPPTFEELSESIEEAVSAILDECEISIKQVKKVLDNPILRKD